MPYGVRASTSGSRAHPTLASSDRYCANSGPCTEESSSGAKTGSAHSRVASALRQAAKAAAPRDPAAITPSHSRIASRTGSPAGPGTRSRTIAHRGSAEIVNESPRMSCEVLHGQVVPAAEQRVDPGRAVRRGELASQQVALAAPSFVGRHHLAVGRYLVPRQLDPPRPRVGVAPGHDAAPVRGRAHRHPAGVPEPDRPASVRDDHVVDRSHPRVEGAVDVVDRPCAEQGQQRVEAEVAEDRRRVADGEPAASVAVDLEQWPPLGGQRFDGDRVGAAHRDGLLAAVDHVVEGLLEDVLVVRHRVGDRPGHLAGVREVLHARDAREGEAEDVDGSSASSVASRTCA